MSDVLLLAPEWPERALLRAELIEAGHDVVAVDAWPIPSVSRMKPRVVVIDLQGLPDPRRVLDELRLMMPPDRVLVVNALGTMTVDQIREMGYHVMARPASIGDVVAATTSLLRASEARSARRSRE